MHPLIRPDSLLLLVATLPTAAIRLGMTAVGIMYDTLKLEAE